MFRRKALLLHGLLRRPSSRTNTTDIEAATGSREHSLAIHCTSNDNRSYYHHRHSAGMHSLAYSTMNQTTAGACPPSLTSALGGGDPYAIVTALTGCQMYSKRFSFLTAFVSARLRGEGGGLADLVTVLHALAAVTVTADRDGSWPPWWRVRFARAAKVAPRGKSRQQQARSAVEAARLRSYTAHVVADISLLLREAAEASTTVDPSLQEVRVIALLSAIVLAPSAGAAVRLAAEAKRLVTAEAAGCALAAYTQSACIPLDTSEGGEGVKEAVRAPDINKNSNNTTESLWLELWGRVRASCVEGASSLRASSPPGSRARMTEEEVVHMQDVVSGAAVHFTAWHLHCLTSLQRTADATALVRAKDTAVMLPQLPLGTVAELLIALPPEALLTRIANHDEPKTIQDLLSVQLLNQLRSSDLWGTRSGEAALRRLPLVTTHAVLFARMLDYILSMVPQTNTHSDGAQKSLNDVRLLFHCANVDALAASLVPAGQPLTHVMVASADKQRAQSMAVLSSAVHRTISALCGDYFPPQAETPSESAEKKTHMSNTNNNPSRAACDGAVQLGVQLLRDLLVLCSSREDSLPQRAAEPEWRRKLREAHAVRTHKYQLLLAELPHAVLSDTLQALLDKGYLEEGGALGACLVRAQLLDLRYYSLPILGSLYQAVTAVSKSAAADNSNSNSTHVDTIASEVRDLYKRRQDVLGEDVRSVLTAGALTSTSTCTSLAARTGEHNCVASGELLPVNSALLPTAACDLHKYLQPTTSESEGPRGLVAYHSAMHAAHSLSRSHQSGSGRLLLSYSKPSRGFLVGWVVKGTTATVSTEP